MVDLSGKINYTAIVVTQQHLYNSMTGILHYTARRFPGFRVLLTSRKRSGKLFSEVCSYRRDHGSLFTLTRDGRKRFKRVDIVAHPRKFDYTAWFTHSHSSLCSLFPDASTNTHTCEAYILYARQRRYNAHIVPNRRR